RASTRRPSTRSAASSAATTRAARRRSSATTARASSCGARRPSPTASRRPSTSTERSEEHTSELQSRFDLVCRLLLEKKNLEPQITDLHASHARQWVVNQRDFMNTGIVHLSLCNLSSSTLICDPPSSFQRGADIPTI